MFADARGACRIVLGYPPSVAWRWEVFPWFLSGTCRLAIVGLRCLGVPRSCGAHVFTVRSMVSGRDCVFLSPRSYRSLSLLGWGRVPGLRAGSPTSGWLRVILLAIVPEAVPPSSRLVLRLRSGFLFSEPGVCGGFNCLLRLCIPSGCGHPFGSRVSLSLLSPNEGLPWWFFLSDVATPF